MTKPTIGRVVYFYPNRSKYEFGFGFCIYEGMEHAAIITAVHSDSMVNLAVFDRNGKTFPLTSVYFYQEHPEKPSGDYATWMPFQKGQAAKTEALEKQIADASVIATT